MRDIKCKKCNNLKEGWCDRVLDSPDPDMVRTCSHFWEKTNGDRIRAMTDEELAELFAQFEYAIAVDALATFGIDVAEMEHDFTEATKEELEWLQEPCEEVNHDL